MRIIITGGTGMIGRSLCRLLLSANHLVTVLSRNPDEVSGMPEGLRVEKWDGKSTTGWGHLVDGADAVINLAGAGIADSAWTTKRKQVIRESRIQAGLAVRDAIQAAKNKPKVLIQSSAVGYYGAQNSDEKLTEAAPVGKDFLANVCFDWEMSTASVTSLGVRRPILRTGIVLSKRGGALAKMMLPFKFFAGGPLGNGKQWMPWIHLTDEVRAIRFLLENPDADGPFNLSAPEPVTNKEFSQALGKVLHRPALVPAPALAMQAALGEMSTIVLDGQRAVPQKLQALGFTYTYPTLDEALQNLLGQPSTVK